MKKPNREENVDDQDSTIALARYTNPVDRFAQLPEYTRAFLETLDKEDVAAFEDLLLSYKRARTIGWFFKWLIAGMAGVFMAVVAFGEAFSKAAIWVRWFFGRA